MSYLRYYISKGDDWVTEVDAEPSANSTTRSKANCLLQGSLFTHYSTEFTPRDKKSVVTQYNHLNDSAKYYRVEIERLQEISERAYKFLLPLFSCSTRAELVKGDHFELLCATEVGDEVKVALDGRIQRSEGVVRYVGALKDAGRGNYIGVEFEEPIGNCNGSSRGSTYFSCTENHGVFVTIDKIFWIPPKIEEVCDLIDVNDLSDASMEHQERNVDNRRHSFALTGRENAFQYSNPTGDEGTSPPQDPEESCNFYIGDGNTDNVGGLGSANGLCKQSVKKKAASALHDSDVLLPPGIHYVPIPAAVTDNHTNGNGGLDETERVCNNPFKKAVTSIDDFATHVSTTGKSAKDKIGSISSDLYQSAMTKRKQSMPRLKNLLPNQDLRSQSWDERGHGTISQSSKLGVIRKVQSQECTSNALEVPWDSIDSSLQIDSVVEHQNKAIPQFGVIRWVGYLPGTEMLIAGLELEESFSGGCDGRFKGKRYFHCSTGRGLFIPLNACKRDSRFSPQIAQELTSFSAHSAWEQDYIPCQMDIEKQPVGLNRGIQGHLNSCYMDATLYAMFAYSSAFDSFLLRNKRRYDVENYENVRNVLRCGIVNPLRKNGFVSASNILEFRSLLDKLGSVPGLLNQEKDPEEFLTLLLKDILKAEPFVKLRTHQDQTEDVYFCQILMGQNKNDLLPSVQSLLEQSFYATNLQLSETPSVLVVQMPRFGPEKIYKRIKPSETLYLGNISQYASYHCFVCRSTPGTMFCNECYTEFGWHLRNFFFCSGCFALFHSHPDRLEHRQQSVTRTSQLSPCTMTNADLTMDLFAVLCIKTSHYVSFVNTSETGSNWVFFDSMADRKGGSNGYNIPEVSSCPEITDWLHRDMRHVVEADSKTMPEKVQRLFEDAYLCFYRNPRMAMYR